MYRFLVALRTAAVALVVGLSAIATPSSAWAGSTAPTHAGALTTSATQVLPRATVRLAGKLPPLAARRVVLQRYRTGLWVSLAAKKSTRLGRFAFTTTVPATAGTARYRVYAPRKRVAGKMRRAVATPTRSVRVVAGPATTPTPPPTATPPAPPTTGTALAPFPVGTTFTLGDWNVRLGTTDTDAWPEIASASLLNLPPLPGWSYVTVPVTFTNAAQTAKTPATDVVIEFLGSDHVVYNNNLGAQTCGLVMNAVSTITALTSGGSATGTQCAVVPTSSIEGGLWRLHTSDLSTERFALMR